MSEKSCIVLAVKLALSGWSYQAISDLFQIANGFISKWKKRCKEAELSGLKLSYQGSKSYLSVQQKQQVINWLQQQSIKI